MQCTHPLLGIRDQKTGSFKIFGSYDERLKSNDPRYLYQPIPCGQCIACRLNKSREWAARMVLEAQNYSENYLVTLTYDDDHVPITYYPAPETGEAVPALTLQKKDIQDFMKRLRISSERKGRVECATTGIRFYAAGEYGDLKHRPHYHLCIFGLRLSDDLKNPSKTQTGFPQYESPFLESVWKFGRLRVSFFSFDTAAYVARYVLKKRTGQDAEFYDAFNLQPEFSLMSRRPGLGRSYYDEHKESIYRFDRISLPVSDGFKEVRPPSYYDRLFDVDDPDVMAATKAARIAAARRQNAFSASRSDLPADERRELLDRTNKKKVSKLPRPIDAANY